MTRREMKEEKTFVRKSIRRTIVCCLLTIGALICIVFGSVAVDCTITLIRWSTNPTKDLIQMFENMQRWSDVGRWVYLSSMTNTGTILMMLTIFGAFVLGVWMAILAYRVGKEQSIAWRRHKRRLKERVEDD